MVVLTKDFSKDLFQSIQSDSGQVFLIKALVGKVELFPEGFPVKGRFSVKVKDVVGGDQDGCEVVDQGSRPVEDEISDQRISGLLT